MPEKLSEGDTITLQGEVTLVHDDGTGDGAPARLRFTTTGAHLSLVAREDRAPGASRFMTGRTWGASVAPPLRREPRRDVSD